MHLVLWVLTVLCLAFGLFLILSPGGFTRVSKTVDKRYSTDNLAEILERYIDINERLLRFVRVIGVFALIAGIFLLLSVLKLP
jgi:TRAP-type C4-dicarboxylate transport system permease small subunit